MKISKAVIHVMVVSCKKTKNDKGYMLVCLQDDNPFMVFSKTSVECTAPQYTDLIVDINCYVDRSSGEFKEFCSVTE